LNPLGKDRMFTNPEFDFEHDLINWLKNENKSLTNFKMNTKIKIKFILNEKQFKIVEDKLEIFGNSPSGRSQVIKRTPIEMLWRTPIIAS